MALYYPWPLDVDRIARFCGPLNCPNVSVQSAQCARSLYGQAFYMLMKGHILV